MGLVINSPQGAPKIDTNVKKELINEFQGASSKNQFMNEMIEIKQKPSESVWEVDQKFKRQEGKLKYPIIDIQHRHLFINSLLPHLKYPLRNFFSKLRLRPCKQPCNWRKISINIQIQL
jgi:hypothetical protein